MDMDPVNQTFALLAPDGVTEIPVWIHDVDEVINEAVAISINYASQIGACFIMLLVVLAMTARNRIYRITTLINIAALLVGTVRCTLLACYFTSSYLEFYTFFAHDYSYVDPADTRVSVAATVFAVPQLVLIEAALAVQAWALVQLWQPLWKWLAVALSGLLAFLALGFKCASVSLQVRAIVDFFDPTPYIWVRQSDLAFGTATISWFCFIFMLRLALHMLEHRTILPPVKGLSAMDVLVMTNGVLMLVPVLFAGLEFGTFQSFESGSLTYTSVIVALPLGTLVAQRLAAAGTYTSQADTPPHPPHVRLGEQEALPGLVVAPLEQPRVADTGRCPGVGFPKNKVDPVDLELQRIDETGRLGSGVWVDREFELRHEHRS